MKLRKTFMAVLLVTAVTYSIKAEEKIIDGIPYVTLNNGQQMPRFGIGTYNVPGDSTAADAVLFALNNGYRHIDTAHAYRVERGVGQAITESGVPREEIWVTSKLWPSEYSDADAAIDRMLERLGLDYIDLLYGQQPMGDWRGAWRAMEELYKNTLCMTCSGCNRLYDEQFKGIYRCKNYLRMEGNNYAKKYETR